MNLEIKLNRRDGVITTIELKEAFEGKNGIQGLNVDNDKVFIPYSSIFYYFIK